VSTAFNADGGYIFRLADGSRWTQMDGKPIAVEPRTGDKVVVKKGVLGSYILSVARQPGVKVKRIN
jgi:topoisomerase IA-like protein